MEPRHLPLKLRNKSSSVLLAVYNSAAFSTVKEGVQIKADEDSHSSYSGSIIPVSPTTIYKYPGRHKGWVLEEVPDELPAENQYREDREMLEAAKKGDMSAIKALPPRRSKVNAKEFIHTTIDILVE